MAEIAAAKEDGPGHLRSSRRQLLKVDLKTKNLFRSVF